MSGYWLTAKYKEGFAFSAMLLKHEDQIEFKGSMCVVTPDSKAKQLYFAWWGPEVNRAWDPFDQPSQFSYLPLGYDDLHRIELPVGELLVSKAYINLTQGACLAVPFKYPGVINVREYKSQIWTELVWLIDTAVHQKSRSGVCDYFGSNFTPSWGIVEK